MGVFHDSPLCSIIPHQHPKFNGVDKVYIEHHGVERRLHDQSNSTRHSRDDL